MKIALAGNPNSGKTTVFNKLTGENQRVGNWPGVTVEKKEGHLKSKPHVKIIDLPGVYSLSPYSPEEIVARNYLINEKPDCILNVVDGTNLERNLYLTTQLLELNIPTVVAINMIDVVAKRGQNINPKILSKEFGCPFISVSALKNKGIEEAIYKAEEISKNKYIRNKNKFFSGKIESYLSQIESSLSGEVSENLRRFVSVKLFEEDKKVESIFKKPEKTKRILSAAKKEIKKDLESVIINQRYNYITKITQKAWQKPKADLFTISDKIDKIVTNKYLAFPIFALIIFLVYYISVSIAGAFFTDFAQEKIFGNGLKIFGTFIPSIPEITENFLLSIGTADWLNSLILDGIISGVGAVLGFVPQIFILFVMLAFLEYCGYMSRIAFILDKIFRKFGLSGKSFIPMIIGTGCSVPGIMASRTIENESNRKITIITTSFIPCSAKMPVIALVASAFFNGVWWIAPSAYFIGAYSVIISGLILNKFNIFSSNISPFVLELPDYHIPTIKNVFNSAWQKSYDFIKKAGTVIFVCSIFIWFFSNFGITNGGIARVNDISQSFLAVLGSSVAWVFEPLGFGNWQCALASLTGLIAKENLVSTLSILYSFNGESGNIEFLEKITYMFTPLSAYSFLLFNMLCVPCVAAVSAIIREMRSLKWSAFALLYQCLFAYCASFCVYQIGLVFSGIISFYTALAILVLAVFIFFIFRKSK